MSTDGAAPSQTNPAQTLLAPTTASTPLLGEAAGKSSIMWVQLTASTESAERAFPVWYAWVTDRFYVVAGAGEQLLPPLPEVVGLILRSKDSGGRLITVRATAHLLPPHTESWEAATGALAGERLNATDDVRARWAEAGSVYALHPFGDPLAAPGNQSDDSGRAPLVPAPPTTTGWRPFHVGRS